MKNNKMKLKNLKVQSFVTNLNVETTETAKGGATATVCGKFECITVVTRGLWTQCCGSGLEC